MKNTNNKLIAGLLVVIAVCMISIVAILLMNRSNGADGTQVVNEAVNEEYPAEESAQQENTESQSNVSVFATESPYYQYDGELSDTPITPTEVENVEMLDDIRDMTEALKKCIIECILNTASELEVYANPTIVPGCETNSSDFLLIVDLHTKDNQFISYSASAKTGKQSPIMDPLDFDTFRPVVRNGLYVINSQHAYSYLHNYTKIERNEYDEIISIMLDKIYNDCKKDNLPIDDAPYVYMDQWTLYENYYYLQFKFVANGIHGTFSCSGTDIKNYKDDMQVHPGMYYHLKRSDT